MSFPQSTEIKDEIDNFQAKASTPLVGKIPLSIHPKFKCYFCEKSLQTKSDLINHQNLDHKGHPKKSVCEEGEQICTHATMLISHKETEHNMFICARCNIQFYGKESLNQHTGKQHI